MKEEDRPEARQDHPVMLWQMDNMAHQLDHTTRRSSKVGGQIAIMQESPVKTFISHTMNVVERTGIKSLDKTVSALGVKDGLETMQKVVSASMTDIKSSIAKIEAVGQELRSAGRHLKNVCRAASGKERRTVDGDTEGRFQSAILFPLRAERDILVGLNDLTLVAIGNVERLEQAAGNKEMKNIAPAGDDVLPECPVEKNRQQHILPRCKIRNREQRRRLYEYAGTGI